MCALGAFDLRPNSAIRRRASSMLRASSPASPGRSANLERAANCLRWREAPLANDAGRDRMRSADPIRTEMHPWLAQREAEAIEFAPFDIAQLKPLGLGESPYRPISSFPLNAQCAAELKRYLRLNRAASHNRRTAYRARRRRAYCESDEVAGVVAAVAGQGGDAAVAAQGLIAERRSTYPSVGST